MYGWAITLALIALVAAILGFGGIAGFLADLALIIFVLALIGSVILFVIGWRAGRGASRRL